MTTAATPAGGPSASETKTPQSPAAGEPKAGEPAAGEPKAGETKVGEPAAGEPKAGEPGAAAASKVPEKYALTFPAGGHVDASDLTEIETLARESQWTNDEAQAFVNEHAARIKKAAERFQETTKADPVYGGAHWDDTQKHVNTALDKLRPVGTPRGDAFRALLNKSGYGNQLEVMAFLADLGQQMAEDTPVGGIASGGVESKDAASSLYGTGPQVKS